MKRKERDILRGRVKDLRKRLKDFFGIKDDPFHPHYQYKIYKTKFILRRNPFEGTTPYTQDDYRPDEGPAIENEDIRNLYSECLRRPTKKRKTSEYTDEDSFN